MTDYDIEVEIFYDEWDNEIVDVHNIKTGKDHLYHVEELEGSNLLDLINSEKITVYGQEDEYTEEEHYSIYGW